MSFDVQKGYDLDQALSLLGDQSTRARDIAREIDDYPSITGNSGSDTSGSDGAFETEVGTTNRRRGRKATKTDPDSIATREQQRANRSLAPNQRRKPGRPRTKPLSKPKLRVGRPAKERSPNSKRDEGIPKRDRGRPRSTDRKYERRRERELEDAIADQLASCPLGDAEGQRMLVASLALNRCKKRFGHLPLATLKITEEKIQETVRLHENTAQYYRQTLKTNREKQVFRETVMQGVTNKTVSSTLGVSARTVRRYVTAQLDHKLLFTESTEEFEEFEDEPDIGTLERDLYVKFFEDSTHVLSGSFRSTRVLDIPKFQLYAKLFGAYPRLLRELHAQHPDVLEQLPSKSRLRVAMEAAIQNGQRQDFNVDEECTSRKTMAIQRYLKKLGAKRMRTFRSIRPARVKKCSEFERLFSTEETERESKVRPIGDAKFLRIVKEAKIRWTKKSKPYNCPLHDKGPGWKVELTKTTDDLVVVNHRLAELGANKASLGPEQRNEVSTLSQQKKELQKKQRELSADVARYERHLKQFAVCRQELEDLAQRLKPGQCIMYRDFVNQYTTGGKKMANLMLVILFRENEGDPLQQLKVYNFSGGGKSVKCDPYFVADVMDFHMKPKSEGGSGVLERFTTVYISGDHGSHFSSTKTVFNESRMHSLYGKRVHVISLCSYHCYNRCDSAGVLGKRVAEKLGLDGKEIETPPEYARAVNSDGAPDVVAFSFDEINRSTKLFGGEKILSKKNEIGVALRSMCEIVYEVKDNSGADVFLAGVAKCRAVPGEGQWTYFDLRSRYQKTFCRGCSEKHDGPRYHQSHAELKKCRMGHAQDCGLAAEGIDVDAHPANDPRRQEMLLDTQDTGRNVSGAGRNQFMQMSFLHQEVEMGLHGQQSHEEVSPELRCNRARLP